MTQSLSRDLRTRVLSAVCGGLSTRKAAARFGVGVSTVGSWYRRYRVTGEIEARAKGPPRGSKLDSQEDFILGLVEESPDISLAEIAGRLLAERSVSAVPSTVHLFFKQRNISFKKNRARR